MTSFKNLTSAIAIFAVVGVFTFAVVATKINAQTNITFSQADAGTVTAVDTVAKTVTISHVQPFMEYPLQSFAEHPPVPVSYDLRKNSDVVSQGQALFINALDQVENDITKMKVGDTVTVYYRTEGAVTTPYAVKDFSLVPPGCDPRTKTCIKTWTMTPGGTINPLTPAPIDLPMMPAPTIVNNLSTGVKSGEVTTLQQELQSLGYFPKETQPTGYFGPLTEKSVIAFQTAEGLPATGFVGPLTRKALTAETAVIMSVNPETAGLAKYLDEPLTSIPTTPVSIKFLVEHRTALNGKTVTVQGFVVYALLGKDACPGGGIGACAQPRIFLADTTDQGRNKEYDVMVLLREEDMSYSVGQSAIVTGVVASSKVAVYLTKSY